MGFFCMVALDILTFNCFSYFSCNVLFKVDSIIQVVCLPLPFFVAALSHFFCDEEDGLMFLLLP